MVTFVKIKMSSEFQVELFSQWSTSMPREIVQIRQIVPIKRSLLLISYCLCVYSAITFRLLLKISVERNNMSTVHEYSTYLVSLI